MKNKLLVIVGPTGTGKTKYSIEIAQHLGCDIISADSRQFFRDLKIGTAPPDSIQLEMVNHHFIGFLPLDQYYSASIFEKDVLSLLNTLFKTKNTAILTGGSTLYVETICNGIDDIPDVDPAIRKKYTDKYNKEGLNGLKEALKKMDPKHYGMVDLNNHKRIIRALEICETTGLPYSSFLTGKIKQRDFDIIKIGIRRPRKDLYNIINARVDQMIDSGLEEEARKFISLRHLNSLDTVGYKEFFGYFDGEYDKETAINLIKRNSRRYAKRQITWWGKDRDINWFDTDGDVNIIEFIEQFIRKGTL